MRRWLLVAALGAAFLTSSMWAQRRGGGGVAGHGGFAGQAGAVSHGSISGGRGTLSGGSAPATSGSFWAGRSGGWPYSNGWNYPHYGSNWRGYPYYHYGQRAYYGLWYGYPWWAFDWSTADSYPAQTYTYYESPPEDYAQEQAARQQAELDELHNEVALLREQRRAQSAPTPVTTNVAELTELIFRDKHTEQIENYAIVGQTLWVFNEQRARKVALADLDIAATKQTNEARGVEFNLPR